MTANDIVAVVGVLAGVVVGWIGGVLYEIERQERSRKSAPR